MENQLKYIENIVGLINNEIEEARNNQDGLVNIVEMCATNDTVLKFFDVLQFFLDPTKNHNHSDYCDEFIGLLNKNQYRAGKKLIDYKSGDGTTVEHNVNVGSETLDLVIYTEKCVIVLDNCVNKTQSISASTLKSFSEKNKNKELFYVCLALDEKSLPEDSLSEEKLKNCSSGMNITYKNDIHHLLGKFKTKPSEEILKGGIIQYRDLVAIYTGKRKDFDEKKLFNTKFFEFIYEPNNMNQMMEIIKENPAENVQKALNLILYVQFVQALKDQLMSAPERYRSSFYYICNNKRFLIEDQWIKEAKDSQTDIGIEFQSSLDDVQIYFMFKNLDEPSCVSGFRFRDKNFAATKNVTPVEVYRNNEIFNYISIDDCNFIVNQFNNKEPYEEDLAKKVFQKYFIDRLF